MQDGKLLVILPTYNESADIERMVAAIKALGLDTGILIIDDNSPDGTGRIADKISSGDKEVFVVHRKKKLGLGSAYICGFKFAIEHGFDYVCEMDADFSHDPKYLPEFYRYIKDYDVVTGSRYMQGVSIVNWPFGRLMLSFLANKFVKMVTGLPLSDCMGGFKCFRVSFIKQIGPQNIISAGYVFQMEMLYRAFKAGCRIKEIPIIFYNRKYGKSKMNKAEVSWSFFLVLYLRFLFLFKGHKGTRR
ncbi:MAG: polyprenol monophosphomannose synthase [Candidatus Omnitrophota bacterium]